MKKTIASVKVYIIRIARGEGVKTFAQQLICFNFLQTKVWPLDHVLFTFRKSLIYNIHRPCDYRYLVTVHNIVESSEIRINRDYIIINKWQKINIISFINILSLENLSSFHFISQCWV